MNNEIQILNINISLCIIENSDTLHADYKGFHCVFFSSNCGVCYKKI